MSAPSLVDALNPRQREAVTHTGGPCLVLAGAGSGKTRVITHRIAWLIRERKVAPERICAVTFTNKAAAEMRARVRALLQAEERTDLEDLWVLTFHALGLRLLRRAAGRPGAPKPGFAVYDRAEALAVWRDCQARLDVDPKEYRPASLYEACSQAVNRLEDPGAWDESGRRTEQRLAGRIFAAYRESLGRRNAVDFDDLLLRPLRLLRGDADLRESVHGRFRHLLIDEYQDTNRLQYRLVRALLGREASLMVVGDEDQSIYRWRGADLSNVLDFQRDFPGATVVRLEQNYRSTAPILAAAGSLVAHNRERLGKKLWTETEGGETPLFMLCGSERREAVWVAKRIAAAQAEGLAPAQIAILYRTNAQSRPFEEELAGRGIPFRVIGGPTFFRRAEVRDLLAYLRLVVTDDDAALARAASTPSRGVGPVTLESLATGAGGAAAQLRALGEHGDPQARLTELGIVGRAASGVLQLASVVAGLRELLGDVSLADLLEATLERSGYRGMLERSKDGEDRLANLDELVASAQELGGDEPADAALVTRFLDRAALISDADTGRGAGGGVSLLTVHAAKGLEFDVVFLTGLEEGVLPHGSSVREGQVEEERRLAYVAMTRARRRLYLSAARTRRMRGREELQRISRFLDELDPGAVIKREEPLSVAEHSAGPRRGGHGRPSGRSRSPAEGRRSRASAAARPVSPDSKGTGVAASPDELVAGKGVFHPMFGPGRITAVEGSGDRLKLTVSFTRAGSKKLLARFARLQLLA